MISGRGTTAAGQELNNAPENRVPQPTNLWQVDRPRGAVGPFLGVLLAQSRGVGGGGVGPVSVHYRTAKLLESRHH